MHPLQAEARALQREQAVAVLQRHADSATADLRGCLAELRAERERVAVGQEEAVKLRDGVEELRMELRGANRKVCGAVGMWGSIGPSLMGAAALVLLPKCSQERSILRSPASARTWALCGHVGQQCSLEQAKALQSLIP